MTVGDNGIRVLFDSYHYDMVGVWVHGTFPKLGYVSRGLGVPITTIVVFRGLYWGPAASRNYMLHRFG